MITLRIAELAVVRGYTIGRLQHATGLSPSTMRRYWYNRVQRVSLPALEAFARVLEVSVADLFARDRPVAISAATADEHLEIT